MLIPGFLFYFVPGEWISIQKDSTAYLVDRGREGVLPGYPVFLDFFRNLMGEQYFLHGVVIAQSALALACTFLFVIVLQRQFQLCGWECILLYMGSMMPFSIYLPECGITHQIMTEGITYALFYLYFLATVKAVWTLKYRWYWGSMGFAFLLGLIRSQMIFLQALGLLLLIWITVNRAGKGMVRKTAYFVSAMIAGVVLALLSYKLIYTVSACDLQRQAERKQQGAVAAVTEEGQETDTPQREATSQFVSLILSRGFFEADQEDAEIFEDEVLKDIFNRAYRIVNEGGHRYAYAEPGLYMWEDLVYDKMVLDVGEAIMEYDEENPGVRSQSDTEIYLAFGMRLLVKHFGRYLYHAVRLMIPSFIASVFFQIKPIYLICHFITLFIYLFSIGLCIYAARRGGDRHKIEFAVSILIVLIVMVVLINLAFIGIQRYVVYGMGIFYCAMYLLTRDMILIPCFDRFVRRAKREQKE